MSFVIGGMAIPLTVVSVVPSATTKTVRERIIDNFVAALESIHGIANPIANQDNSSQEVQAESGGTYTGTTERTYRLQVVTGGVSGVAEVTATVVSGSPDDGPVAAVITSGSAVTMGALGVTLTLTFSGALVGGDYWDVNVNTYQSNVLKIFRKSDQRDPRGIFGILREVFEDAEDEPIGMVTQRMTLTVTMYLASQSNPEEILDDVLGDCMKAAMADHTRGGLAIDTIPLTNVAFARDEVKSHSGFDLLFEVLYRHRRTDPRLQ